MNDDGKAKRILMTAFHFPPQAGSSGIQRTLGFVNYLPRHGWQPTVLTAHPRAYEATRDDLLAAVPPGVEIVRAQAFDTARHFSLNGKYLRLLALPDRWWTWWPFAVRAGREIVRRARPDLIWSTYPIPSAHLIGRALARLSGLPWIADFRDPMLSADYPPDRLRRKVWRGIEASALAEARACVFTTEEAANVYRERYPAAAARCRVVANGYDEAAFADLAPTRPGLKPGALLLLHSGVVYPRERDPGPFFAAVRALLDSNALARDRLLIRFRAPGHDDEVRALARQHGVADVVDVAPPLPYREALAEMMGADGLLVFQGAAFNAQIPAKIYEYLRAARPLLALVAPDGNTARTLAAFAAVAAADIADERGIAAALAAWLQNLQAPELPQWLARNREDVRAFSRQAQTARFAALCDEIVA
ncbi:MAG: glycosyltransferase [Azoarcus sp.]|jgi:glycosyltransferase involved in cell wall biosynthesis|nr:glycosyltransferase [Azoarcus sp.]